MNPTFGWFYLIDFKLVDNEIYIRMDDIEINYIGEEEGIDESEELNDNYESRTVRVNKDGKKIRPRKRYVLDQENEFQQSSRI